MRIPQREVAAGLRRGLHSNARPSSAPRPLLRSSHQALPVFRAPQRSFFTSSQLLAKEPVDGEDALPDAQTTPARSSSRKKPAKPPAAAAAPAPKKSLSNPLRRVVSIAQRPGRKPGSAGVEGRGPEAEPSDDDDASTKIRAICVAESFDMDMVVRILTEHCYQLDPDGLEFDTADVVHARTLGAGEHGDVFVFPSGTVVTWGLPADVGINMAQGTLLRAAHNHDLDSAERESLSFETNHAMATSTMRGDKVILGTKQPAEDPAAGADGAIYYPTLAKIAFSSGLARSTKIAFLEALLSAYFKRTKEIPAQLLKGRLAVSKKFILQRTGELLELRSQLNLYSELTDSLPDMFWDQDSELRLEQNYDQTGKALDVLDRIKLLNQRMDYAQEMATVMREMYDTDHGAYLEKIIIALICIEVLFEVRHILVEYKESSEMEKLLALELPRAGGRA